MSHENKDYLSILRARGYRATSQRLIVLDAVCAIQGHASIPDIQAKVHFFDPSIDRSTIYRALEVLTTVGLLSETEIDSLKVYRIAGEAQHHHLRCKVCGKTQTIPSEALDNFIQEIQANYGFKILADHLALSGLCTECIASVS